MKPYFTNKTPKNKTHIQQLLPIVRGGKPQREGVTNSRDKIRSAQGVSKSTIHCTEAANLIPRTGVWAVSNSLGSMAPDPHLVLGLSLTVFLLQLITLFN